jgi:hypothetical protein
VVVAVVVVQPVDVAADDVVDVPVVRDRDVFAPDAVQMVRRMFVAVMADARHDVGRTELVFVDVVAVRMVQVPIVHVVDVTFV